MCDHVTTPSFLSLNSVLGVLFTPESSTHTPEPYINAPPVFEVAKVPLDYCMSLFSYEPSDAMSVTPTLASVGTDRSCPTGSKEKFTGSGMTLYKPPVTWLQFILNVRDPHL